MYRACAVEIIFKTSKSYVHMYQNTQHTPKLLFSDLVVNASLNSTNVNLRREFKIRSSYTESKTRRRHVKLRNDQYFLLC